MKHYTSIEQSKKLLELGLNPETADMCWEQHYNREPIITVKPYTTKGKSIGAHCCDAWSLGALLEVMPHIIEDDNYTNEITPLLYPMQGKWFCVYNELDTDGYNPYAEEKGKTPIEAAYSMVVWLIENNYLKTQKDKDYSLMDRIDEIKANSVSDEEFEKTWGKSLDETVDRASKAWDDKLKKYKPKDNKDD